MLFVALLVCLTPPAQPQSGDKLDLKQTGKVFLAMCETTDKVVHNICVAYVKGFTEGAQLALIYQSAYDQVPLKDTVCVPGSLSYGDVLTGFMIFLRAHPEKQDMPSNAVMLEYLTSMYHCSADEYRSPKQ